MTKENIAAIICDSCQHEQRPNTQNCVNCGSLFGKYACFQCIIFSDNVKLFHCDQCQKCYCMDPNVTDETRFAHCDICQGCHSSVRDNQKCLPGSLMSPCAICLDTLYSFGESVLLLDCGHPFHEKCIESYVTSSQEDAIITSPTCPVCAKPILKNGTSLV